MEENNQVINLNNNISNNIDTTYYNTNNINNDIQRINYNEQVRESVINNMVNNVETNIMSNSSTSNTLIDGLVQVSNNLNNVKIGNEVEPNVEKQSLFQDKYILKTETLKSLLSNAKKIAINEGLLPTTTIFQLVFNNEGFKIVATDSENVLIQTDDSVKFTTPAVFSLKSEIAYNLISKLASEYVELIYSKDDDTITVVADSSTFILQQQCDPNTFEPLIIDTSKTEVLPTDSVYTINIEEFKSKVAHAYAFVTNPRVARKLSGVYCGEYILASDASNIAGSPNLPELTNESIYLNEQFVKIFTQLDFIGETKLAIRKDNNGDFVGLIIYTNNMSLSGPAHHLQKDFPLEKIMEIFKGEFKEHTISFNKSQVSYMLSLSGLFINKDLDKDSCRFIINGDTLSIQSISKTAKQDLKVANNNVPYTDFNLKVEDTITALNNCEDTEIVMGVDVKATKAIILTTPNLKQVITTINL